MCEVKTKKNEWEVIISQGEIDAAMQTVSSGIRNRLSNKYKQELENGSISPDQIEERVGEMTERMEEEIFKATRKNEEREDGQYILDVRDATLLEKLIPAKMPA